MEALQHELGISLDISTWLEEDLSLNEETLREKILDQVNYLADEKEKITGSQIMRRLEKQVMLDILDRHWKDHLIAMDQLRQGIHLRSYAAKDPKREYKREAFNLFLDMLHYFKLDVIRFLSKVQVKTEEDIDAAEQQHQRAGKMQFNHPAAPNALGGDENKTLANNPEPFVRDQRKIGRNEPCPCGSGKKYKHCHGKLT